MKKALFLASLAVMFLMFSCGPNNEKSKMYYEQGYDLFYHNQVDESIECFDQAIKYNPDNYEAYYLRGCAFNHNRKIELALKDWEKAIEIKPDYADPYFNIGLHYRRNNDMAMACYYFKLAEKYGRTSMEDYVKYCDHYE